MTIQKKIPTVVVGMSGGVDSSVSALLLKEQGYNVIGLFMKNWEETDELCPAKQDFEDVIRVCDQLDIPCFSVDFSQEYKDEVFKNFLDEYQKGNTPNPDILCNQKIKFHHFFNKAIYELKADYLATGHYCQNLLLNDNHYLAKGKDPNKDQSYFLYTIKQDILKKVLFPIGNIEKTKVRKIASDHQLITSEKKDSTGICFIGKRAFGPFIKKYLTPKPGIIESIEGKILAEHEGLFLFTIGQRKGLHIGGEGQAWFVVQKDFANNKLIVAQGEDHPALFSQSLNCSQLSWVNEAPILPYKCKAKIRYRHEEQNCTLIKEKDQIKVTFEEPQRAITVGQSVVFYQDDICLGGGIISQVGASLFETSFLQTNGLD